MDNNAFMRIDINSLLNDHITNFNLYIMYEDNYVLFKSGDIEYTEKHKQKLLSKKLKLYINSADKKKYILYIKQNLQRLANDDSSGLEEKTKYFYDSSKVLISQIFETDDREDVIENVKTLSDSALNLLNSSGYNLKDILSIMQFEYSTYTHSLNVLMLASSFVKNTGILDDKADIVAKGALLHDIGKVKVDKKILLKPGKLDQFEWEIIRKHPLYGIELLERFDSDMDPIVKNIVRHHHERWDGEGYPDKLMGEEMPIEARLVSICDVFDALTSQRCYKSAIGSYPAFKIMLNEMSGAFNKDLIKSFMAMFKENE